MSKSHIEWTEQTWNPVTGCNKISAGCKHCYAETMARRLQAMGASGYANGFALTCHENRLATPLKRKIPTMYFVNSMSDLFHPQVPFAFIDKVMQTIGETLQHTYQILTKRPERMAKYFLHRDALKNAWLGVSVENKRHGIPRIDVLRNIDATIRFLSVEPLLEDIGEINLTSIDWVIVGGESGRKARPMKQDWVYSIRQQCQDSGVAFFFKQWGGVQKHRHGRMLNNRTYDEMPDPYTKHRP